MHKKIIIIIIILLVIFGYANKKTTSINVFNTYEECINRLDICGKGNCVEINQRSAGCINLPIGKYYLETMNCDGFKQEIFDCLYSK